MNEVCVSPTAVARSHTHTLSAHTHERVIIISYPAHTKTLTLHHLHNEFTADSVSSNPTPEAEWEIL